MPSRNARERGKMFIFYWHLKVVVEILIIFLSFLFFLSLYYNMECTHHDEKLAIGQHSYSNNKRIKKKNSRSKSMFELADNPYADENCCCCNDDHVDASASSTTTRRNSLIYSILTSSTLNHHNDMYTTNTTTSDAMLFLLKFSKLLVSCGAPSHRLDHCLQSLMHKFSVKAQFGYFPGFLVVSFGDAGNI